MNDWQLSQWISQALDGELDSAQQAELEAALQRSPPSQAFAQWSRLIQAAGVETKRIESLPPSDTVFEPTELLSELSKARLQRSLLAAQAEWRAHDTQPHLRVAQSPSVYIQPAAAIHEAQPAAAIHEAQAAERPSDAYRKPDALLRSGRELRSRLSAQGSSLVQAVYWAAELVGLANLQTAAARKPDESPASVASASASSPLSYEQLASVLLSMLRVETGLCAISLASYQTRHQPHSFDELLRVQRGPRDLSHPRPIPSDRLRRGAASPFHQAVFAAASLTPMLEIDRSIAGWPRIALGVPLGVRHLQVETAPVTAASATLAAPATNPREMEIPWGLAIVEADIDRLLHAQIAAAGVDAAVVLIDPYDQLLFSTADQFGTAARSADTLHSLVSELDVARELDLQFARSGEGYLPDRGVWATRLTCPAPLDNLRLVLRAR